MTLTPQILLNAYCQGLFPMADPDEDGAVYWYDPDPRTVIPLETFHVPRRLARTVRQGKFEVRVDSAFQSVMEACAEPREADAKTWISPELINLYTKLYWEGFAHSLETYLDGELVGGVYGVSVRGLFAGESMFSRVTDASKVALVHLLKGLKASGYTLFDVQFTTAHLQRFGAVEVSRAEYKRRLAQALTVSPRALTEQARREPRGRGSSVGGTP